MFGKKTLGRCRIHHCLTLQNGRTINHPKEESCLSVSPNYLLFKEYGTPYIYGISKMCLMGVARLSKEANKNAPIFSTVFHAVSNGFSSFSGIISGCQSS